MVPKCNVGDFDPEQCGPATETKAGHIQGGHNNNNISKNKGCVQKMLMWRCFERARSNSAEPFQNRTGPDKKIPLGVFFFEH